MPWYLAQTHYDRDKLGPVHEKHMAYMENLVSEGILAVAGPMVDGSGGIAILRAESEEAAWEVFNNDPYRIADPTSELTIGEYKVNLGFWLSQDGS